jgi:hypothetical protein
MALLNRWWSSSQSHFMGFISVPVSNTLLQHQDESVDAMLGEIMNLVNVVLGQQRIRLVALVVEEEEEEEQMLHASCHLQRLHYLRGFDLSESIVEEGIRRSYHMTIKSISGDGERRVS